MDANLVLYHGKTLNKVADLSNDIVNLSYTIGLNGSVKGYAEVEATSNNRELLSSLKENSHFVKFGLSKIYGGVVNDAKPNKNIYTINFIGAYEWLEKVDASASHKASLSSGAASDSDYSWIKVFYSDSTVGVLYEILKNLRESMNVRGYDSSLLNFNSLRNFIISNQSSTIWNRSYRLNALETPTVQSVIEDVLSDDGMELFRIRVSSDLNEAFVFIFEVVSSSSVLNIDEASDSVFNVSQDGADVERRAFSISKGTDLMDRSVVERVDWDDSVAYSSLLNNVPQERSNAIRRSAVTAANAAATRYGTLSFSSFVDNIDPLNYVTIGSDRMNTVSGIVTEKSIEGNTISYVVQIGSAASFNGVLKKPSDEMRRIIFNPLGSALNVSGVAANRKENATGWRS